MYFPTNPRVYGSFSFVSKENLHMVTQAKPQVFYLKEFTHNSFTTESTHRRFNNVIADVSSMDTESLETSGKIIPVVLVAT